MDDTFFVYLKQLEMMAFFSGYPLLYAVTLFIAGNPQTRNKFKTRIISLLPYGYALAGTLYLGLQLRNLYPDFSSQNINRVMQQPLLVLWGLFSILFWIPALSKKPFLSLLHSLIFFFLLVKDLFLHSFQSPAGNDVVKNDMKIYTDSLLVNLGSFVFIILISSLVIYYKRHLRR